MKLKSMRILTVLFALVLAMAGVASAETYGNTSPFETQSAHSPDYVLGVQVEIPVNIELQSFGLMYGHESGNPEAANAIFGVYSSNPSSGMPENLMAVTNQINLNSVATYDNIAFTTTPNVPAGTYWMMALYQTAASPRMTLLDGGSLVAYWSMPYGAGMPANAPGALTYFGQDFNYWVNGDLVVTPTLRATWSSLKSIY